MIEGNVRDTAVELLIGDSFFSIDEFNIPILSDFGVFFPSAIIHKPWLLGGADPVFRLNELAFNLLKELGVAKIWYEKLRELLPHEQDWKEDELDKLLDEHLPKLGKRQRKLIKDGLAIAAYRTQTIWPKVTLLVCDDAPQFNWLTVELALCWIHEFRHYKKLTPHIPHHRQTLDTFKEDFWKLYRKLLAYRQNPNQEEADSLQQEFEHLFEQATGYEQLDKRKALTLAKKEALLMVLIHSEILATLQSCRTRCQTASTQT